jgi:sarcosine oxidase gamma subunit
MVETGASPAAVDIDGLTVMQGAWQVASLRYFDSAGAFADAVRESTGESIPKPLRALRVKSGAGDGCILMWRSPTEALLLCADHRAFAAIEQRAAAASDGCLVDQTGGICVLHVTGRRAPDLLSRLGATTAIPALGHALSGRLAELPVLTACLQAGEYLLLVERVYADHLLGWIRATAADF